jgi:mannosyltransferase
MAVSKLHASGMQSASLAIELDCIIFGLQRYGGISNYWDKLREYVQSDASLDAHLLLPKNIQYFQFDRSLLKQAASRRESIDPRLARYLPASVFVPHGIFHTSYYRLPRGTVGRYIVSVYDFTYERYRTGLARHVHSMQKFASIRRADAVLCISDATRRDVLEFCPDVDPSKLHVVPLAVDRTAFYPEFAHKPDGGGEGNVVLFVGQRGGYKRFDLAVEAIRQSKGLVLGVVGPPLTSVEQAHLQQQLGTRWISYGSVPSSQLRRLYSEAYAFIFPSDYEGFGLPVLEAMACGCPVVAANLSSLPEVGGAAALYAQQQSGEAYASALSILQVSDWRAAAIDNGVMRAQEFEWATTMQLTKLVYLG